MFTSTPVSIPLFAISWILLVWCPPSNAQAVSLGYSVIAQEDGGATTIFYPTLAIEAPVSQGPFRLSWALEGEPHQGNGRLVVISHGSGGSPWVHTDLARSLVEHGFVVAIPQHAGDNYIDSSEPGPASWKRRPREVSQAIDRVAAHPKFSALLRLDSVGVFGGSAGGHTALSLAGGEWSPSRFRDHCLSHIEQDFSSCVGFNTLLRGSWFDGLKVWAAKLIIRSRFGDDAPQRYIDKRVHAVVAMVPFAADFAPDSLRTPVVPLGLVIADLDINQVPSFHVKAVQSLCEPRCEVLVELVDGGHGAMLSPLPPFEPGSIADRLLSDPPSFDRAKVIPELNESIAKFFFQQLVAQ
jgi:predicted dienelactone hydrolase